MKKLSLDGTGVIDNWRGEDKNNTIACVPQVYLLRFMFLFFDLLTHALAISLRFQVVVLFFGLKCETFSGEWDKLIK